MFHANYGTVFFCRQGKILQYFYQISAFLQQAQPFGQDRDEILHVCDDRHRGKASAFRLRFSTTSRLPSSRYTALVSMHLMSAFASVLASRHSVRASRCPCTLQKGLSKRPDFAIYADRHSVPSLSLIDISVADFEALCNHRGLQNS